MSTEQTSEISSSSYEDTLTIAATIGSRLRGGEVIELTSDVGGGKTAFVKGLARGAGSQDDVSSPSFTLSNQYRTDDFVIYHFDFYRLNEPGIMRSELAEIIGDEKAVVVVEWANIVEDVLPAEHVRIIIRASGEQERQFQITCPANVDYLFGNT